MASKNIIENDIENNSFHNIYILYGEEAYLKRTYKNMLINKLVNKNNTMNFSRFNEYNFSLDEFVNLADTIPLFSKYRVILCENVQLCSKSNEKFLKYLENINESTIIIDIEEKLNKNTKIFKLIEKSDKAFAYECTLPEDKVKSEVILKNWIYKRLKKYTKSMENDAWEEFFIRTFESMDKMDTEFSKLISYVGDKSIITLDDIKAICVNHTEKRIFDMIDAIGYKDKKKAMDFYKSLVIDKVHPLEILKILRTQFLKIKAVQSMLDKHLDKYTIASRVGIYRTYIDKMIKIANNFSNQELTDFLDKILSYDEKIKLGQIDPSLAIETIILE